MKPSRCALLELSFRSFKFLSLCAANVRVLSLVGTCVSRFFWWRCPNLDTSCHVSEQCWCPQMTQHRPPVNVSIVRSRYLARGIAAPKKNRTSFGDGIYCSVGWLLCGSGATVAKDGPLSRPMSRACVGRSNVLQPFILREDELLDVLCRALELEKFAVALVKTAHLIGA